MDQRLAGSAMKRQHIPHLILGVPSNASPEESSMGFARATKRVKKLDQSPFTVEDLTAALASVESASKRSSAFVYSLPSDPEFLVGWTAEAAEFARAEEHQDVERAAAGHVVTAVRSLLEWKWDDAETSAKKALRLSHVEATRDEALNCLALSMAMRGETDKAVAALKQAVEGQWNVSLQQNLGILALEGDPELAANQATYCLEAAETVEEREQALLTVLGMWMSLRDGEGEDEEIVLPTRIRMSFRQALAAELPEDTFRLLGTFLAQYDKDWVLKASNWAGGPLGDTETASLIHARAEGLDHFLDFLMENAQSSSKAVQDSINRLVSDMNEVMFAEGDALFAAGVCMNLFERGLDFSSFERVLARPLTVREICMAVGGDDGEPVEQVLDWLAQAQAAIPVLDIIEESKDVLREVTGNGGNIAATVFHDSRMAYGQRIADNVQEINALHLGYRGRRRINKAGLREATSAMSRWCSDTRRIHGKCMKVATNEEIRSAWNELMTAVAGLERNIRAYI